MEPVPTQDDRLRDELIGKFAPLFLLGIDMLVASFEHVLGRRLPRVAVSYSS